MTDPIGSVFLYRLVSGLGRAPELPAGFEWASDPCPRYGSRWASRAA